MFRIAFAAAAALALVVGPADAQPTRIQVGTLTCAMSSSIGLILGSQKNVNCEFAGRPGEPIETYTGTMTTIGLDIGVTGGGVIVWSVFAESNRYAGMLAGKYVGATAEVSELPASAPTFLLAGRIERWRCNRCRYRDRSASTSPPGSAISSCIRCDRFQPSIVNSALALGSRSKGAKMPRLLTAPASA